MLRYPNEFEPLVTAFRAAGRQLWFVGGCIRDALMQVADKGDWDVATDAHPDEIQKILRANGLRSIPIGIRFGTVATLLGGQQVEITTFRRAERYEKGSRHPVVEFGERIEEDLSRRDLSINAIAMNPEFELVDPFDGAGAIRRRILEVPGGGLDNSISILRDDPLRLLRVARFCARLDFAPTSETTEAARAVRASLHEISRERWKMELDKLLAARNVGKGLRWLGETHAICELFPAFSFDPDSLVDALARRVALAPPQLGVRWPVLLLHLAAAQESRDVIDTVSGRAVPSIEARLATVDLVATELRASNAERVEWARQLAAPLVASQFTDASRPRLRRTIDSVGVAAATAAPAVAMALADGRDTGAIAAWADALRELLASEDPVPRFPPGLGTQLMATLGIRGRAVGDTMDALRAAVFDGEVPNGAGAEVYVDFARELRSRT